MKARQDGRTITLTMTAREAKQLEDELLWAREGDEWSIKVWEALKALHPEQD